MKGGWLVLAAIVALPVQCPPRAPLRIATFNIENFPRNDRQVALAFAELRRTGAPVIALQGITRPDALADAAVRELGPRWRALTTDGDQHRLGLVYDADRVELVSARTRDETRVVPGARPTLEARVRSGGRGARLLVVHLKSGADPAGVRARQLAALEALVAEDPRDTVVLGDFNSSTPADRAAVARLAAATGLGWASADLGCTALWDAPEGCRWAALDQVLASGPATTTAGGPCASGCPAVDRCPTWRDEVSDHCPVTAVLR